ncbi:hypothetical protein BOTBODRAFT_111897 [Botryobasidium botryosum FD-172 SS1]|uniref:Phosphatidylinositol N-acetylglucosaminyltransferase n=1 Tax=Botryobasidium botryosum (strain FD-172 SS1) TaxID=930990 RepID=A0A067MNH6_BOTB1|nr:hypothetical protein BOTBODRAFT_111897 [Botryobasidium botryosum FD-172 SS1]
MSEWERVLWKKQAYADNYIPPSFLSSLRRNANVHPYTYAPLVLASCAIIQHISAVFILLSAFVHLHTMALDPRLLVWVSILCFLLGYTAWELTQARTNTSTEMRWWRAKAFKSSILVFLALLALSPVLKTLTEATSSDSIWALSAFLLGLNVLLADYSSSFDRTTTKLTSVLSMNAGISASVVLASRLSSNLSVFALILFAVQLLALLPILRKYLNTSPLRILISTALLITASGVLIMPISSALAFVQGGILAFIGLACPAVLVWAQKYKNEIKGSWDPAVPQLR